jgi:hypothetical protein
MQRWESSLALQVVDGRKLKGMEYVDEIAIRSVRSPKGTMPGGWLYTGFESSPSTKVLW